MGNYLAFDLGASSGRGIIGTLENGTLKLEEIHRFANGPRECDGSIYWDFPALVAELKIGIRKALLRNPKIDSIAIDTWGVDYVLFDRDTKEPIRLPYHYRDARTEKSSQAVWKNLSRTELYQATGIQCMTLNTVYQLAAHHAEHPEELKNSVFLDIPDALAFALGGDFTSEYSHASTTNLLDPATRKWNWKLIDKLGLPRDMFPELVSPCTPGGTLSAAVQAELGCGAIPITKIGSHDTASAVLAVPAPQSGSWAYISAGTWALLGAELDHPVISAASEQEGFTNEGGVGGKIRFLTNIMGSWLFQETRRIWNEAGRKLSFADMEQMALDAEPCQFFVDPNAAEFAPPGDMPGRIIEFCRRTRQGEITEDAELVRAIYDSLALYFSCKLETLGKLLGTAYGCLNIVGGGTKDRLLMQLTADALNIPVVAGPVEATAVGNLLGQALAAGEITDISAARQVVRDSFEVTTYRPDAALHDLYRRARSRFEAVTRK